jgi:flagella basal body P-ring formation protein FlgA
MFRKIASLMVLLSAVAYPALANAAALKPEIKVTRDVVTYHDLVDGLESGQGIDPTLSATPLFRAPALGESGTIQIVRVLDALHKMGLPDLDTRGLTQITVMRDARRIQARDFEEVLIRALNDKYRLSASSISIIFDGTPPALIVAPDVNGALKIDDLSYDPRARRITGTVSVASENGSQRRSVRVAGQLVEMSTVVIVSRALNRGEALQMGDVSIEKRPRDSIPSDAISDTNNLNGFVARRTLIPGSPLRNGDLIRPDVIARGDTVTIVYEGKGLMLTARGKALEAGGVGTVIGVQNLQSKRTVQATIAGAGKVIVSSTSLSALNSSASNASKPTTVANSPFVSR